MGAGAGFLSRRDIVAGPTDVIGSSSHAVRKRGEARTGGMAGRVVDSPVQSPLRRAFGLEWLGACVRDQTAEWWLQSMAVFFRVGSR